MDKQPTPSSSSSKNVLVLAAIVTALGIAVAGISFLDKTDNPQPAQNAEVAGVQAFSYQGEEGRTALELLRENYDIETQEYSFGEMVTSINGVKADKDEFWSFYVDGEMAQVGAGEYVATGGEKIEWKLEEVR